MDRPTFRQSMEDLGLVYGRDVPSKLMNLYYADLQYVDAQVWELAVVYLRRTLKFFPTIAECIAAVDWVLTTAGVFPPASDAAWTELVGWIENGEYGYASEHLRPLTYQVAREIGLPVLRDASKYELGELRKRFMYLYGAARTERVLRYDALAHPLPAGGDDAPSALALVAGAS